MPDESTNGGSGGSSRLDRIEAALERFAQDHEEFREEHKRLLTAQILMQDRMDKSFAKFDERMSEVTDKLNGVIGVVDQLTRDVTRLGRNIEEMREHFDTRIRRLEER
jgi:hypothetical protein